MTVPTRVLHIMSGFRGGIEAFIKNKAKELPDDMVFDIICLEEPPADFKELIESKNGKIFYLLNPKVYGFNQFFKQLDKIFKVFPKDTLIHSHIAGYKCLPFYFVAKKNKMERFVIHAHTSEAFGRHGVELKIVQSLNRHMADQMASCGKKATETIFGVDTDKEKSVMHIPNSIDLDEYQNTVNKEKQKKELLGVEDDRLIIGHIGRLRYLKNQPFILDVLKELKKHNNHFLCYIAGIGPLLEDLQQQVKAYNLENHVKFLGFRTDIPELLKITDIFLLPSLNEGLPTVVIEAQAAKAFSIVSDTVTRECDLELGLVKFSSIENVVEWLDIIKSEPTNDLSTKNLLDTINRRHFSNEQSFNLYKQFVEKEIDTYNI